MVWQKGVIQFTEFFDLFLPAVVNFVIPAAIMHFAIPRGKPSSVKSNGDRNLPPTLRAQ
jgi:Na+/H+ antiporter NhaD/arsenite permease-like protein